MTRELSTLHSNELAKPGHTADAPPVPGLALVFSAGVPRATVLPLERGELVLGRGDTLLEEVHDLKMSRRHARVRHDGQSFWVTDLDSQNGTWVDGEPLAPGVERAARRVLRMGNSLFVLQPDVRPLRQRGVERKDGHVRGPAVQLLLEEVRRAAQLGYPLHIHGESGTGKEGIARAYHASGAAAGPFVAVNCATIPAGLAERLLFGTRRGAYSGADADAPGHLQEADGGTLFLDEVAELDLGVQAKLLRVLETKEVQPLGSSRARKVELRICSATHKDLRDLVAAGRLRADLYYRIARPAVTLPPLRQRPEEIPQLLRDEIERLGPGMELHVSLVEACLIRPWPGNVRELLIEARNATQSACLQGARRVEARHLSPSAGTAFGGPAPPVAAAPPDPPPPPRTRVKPLDPEDRARIEEALRREGGNIAAAARALGMHRTQLRRLLERHAIR